MTEENTSYPSLPEQAKNLAKFSFDVVRTALSNNSLMVSDEVREARLNTCRECEYYDPKQVRCRHCGCFLDHKVSFAIDSCPLDKWKVSDEQWINQSYNDILEKIEKGEHDPEFEEGPRFPLEAELGEIYTYENQTWQYNGRMWMIVNPE
jgi:hypothetical protein